MAEIAATLGVRATMDTGDFVRSSKKADAEVKRLTHSIQLQIDTIKYGAQRAQLSDLVDRGASPEAVGKLGNLQDELRGLQSQAQATAATIGSENSEGLLGRFNKFSKLLRGGGILIGAKIISHQFENITEAIVKSTASGGDFEDQLLAMGLAIPIIGDLGRGFANLADIIRGTSGEWENLVKHQEGLKSLKEFTEKLFAAGASRRQPDSFSKEFVDASKDHADAIMAINKAASDLRDTMDPEDLIKESKRISDMQQTALDEADKQYKERMEKASGDRLKNEIDTLKKISQKRKEALDKQFANEQIQRTTTVNEPDFYDPEKDPILISMKARADELDALERKTREAALSKSDIAKREIADLNELRSKNRITLDEYEKRIKAISGELGSRITGSPFGELATLGSAAALQLERRTMFGSGENIDREQLVSDRKREKLQEQIRDAIEKDKLVVVDF